MIEILLLILVFISVYAVIKLFKKLNPDKIAQRQLDGYLRQEFSKEKIGQAYERYIGYLFEKDGFNVVYNGAINGFSDRGRDLIVRSKDEVLVVQTKCWAKYKLIQEKHIFQLYGTTAHFNLTATTGGRSTRAILFTTAIFSDTAISAAKVLGVELKTVALDMTYPMIKCYISFAGEKIYCMPFDADYDKVKIDIGKGECFVKAVADATKKGFARG